MVAMFGLGKWYYVCSELYLFVPNLVFMKIAHTIASIIAPASFEDPKKKSS